jgi:hypothetical protein
MRVLTSYTAMNDQDKALFVKTCQFGNKLTE